MQTTNATTTNSASKFVKSNEWDPQANRFMQPKMNDRGLKTVIVINTQKNKKFHLQLPPMISYGISDYTDQATGESDGKYTIKLHFSGKEGVPEVVKQTREKLQQFEQFIIGEAVVNSEAWFGKKLSRELIEDRYFPFLKVGKNSETKEPDESKGFYFRPKVNRYSEKWDIEIFDNYKNMIFPSENEASTPMDFVPSNTEVTCGVECKNVWLGAKGWGISWALKQCVVTPVAVEQSSGSCLLDVPVPDSQPMITTPPVVPIQPEQAETLPTPPVEENKTQTTYVEDSDNEEQPIVPPETVEPVKEDPEEEEAPKPVAKKVVKKAPAAPEPSTEEVTPAATTTTTVKKKVVRKKA
jgi:hypothetical protein